MSLTAKQVAFVDCYLQLGNATQAAIQAGYSSKTAYSIGQRLLKKVEVKTRLDERRKELESQRIATAQEVLVTLTDVLRGKVTNDKREESEDGVKQTTEATPVKDRVKAAELLGRRFGLWDKKQDGSAEALTRLDGLLEAFQNAVKSETD